ncbi:MAG: hypothetical protein WDN49_05805 [Acetobacteraceae bacterium]
MLKLSQSFSQADDRANTRYMLIFCEHALALGYTGNPLGGLAAVAEILERLVETGGAMVYSRTLPLPGSTPAYERRRSI